MIISKIKIVFLLFLGMFWYYSVFAYIMESDNYRIQSESLNIGGRDEVNSLNYSVKETSGEISSESILTSSKFKLKAGYRQMHEFSLSLSAPDDVELGSFGGLGGGLAINSAVWTVITDNPAGYELSAKSLTSPAMKAGDIGLNDYTPVVPGTPDYIWEIASAAAEFGYSPYNANSQVAKFKNNASACNIGSSIDDTKCWYNFSTDYELIAKRGSRTSLSGEDTKLNLKAEYNPENGLQEAGNYRADIKVTAVGN